jgi:branched-chain amino acid transport system ATP-binding protein
VLVANKIVCAYLTDIEIVRGVTLSVEPGKVTSIIGPNGVGKSTLLKGLYGTIPVQNGTIELDGLNVENSSMAARFKSGIRYLPQDSSVFPYMTVLENLKLFAWADAVEHRAFEDQVFQTFPILQERLSAKAGDLSGGQQKQLEFSRFLCGKTKYALVDEPSVGLSPSMSATIYDFLGRMRNQGMGILLVDQQVAAAIEIADHVYVIDGGKVVDEGSGERFRRSLGEVVSKWLIA